MRERHHVADEIESRFASDRYTLAELATFTKAVLPTILVALREGHLEGDAVAGAEDAAWPNGCLKPNSCARNRQCVYALTAAACRHFGTDIGTAIERALPVKTGGRHGE